MGHHGTVRSEFSRQADAFARSEVLRARELTEPVGEALGHDVGRVLDLACGPGSSRRRSRGARATPWRRSGSA